MRSIIRLIIVIVLFGAAPLLVDRIISDRQRQQDTRDDELVKAYECYPVDACVADFNGDGIPARFDFAQTYAVGGHLAVTEGGKEVLRLAYDHTDNTLRTHMAIHNQNSKVHLLVYDGASQRPALKTAYEWNGEKLIEVKPSDIEEEILSAMAAHDDTGGWNERVFRGLKRMLYLGAYYLVFFIATVVVLFRRLRRSPNSTTDKAEVDGLEQAV